MEIDKGGGGGGGGGGEFRRVNVVYFLSRGGNVEHPHLIRVHHLNRAGVRLRDVKRWLSELRGKDMPDSFSWSYKRRYRSGYVWQDLTDDDLITPISDNEFVLKGSELPHRPLHPSSTINDLQPRPFPPPLISEKSSRVTAAATAAEEKEKEATEAAEATTAVTAAERPKPNSSPAETLRIVLEDDDEDDDDDEVLSPNLPPPPPPRDSSDESAAQRRRSAVFKIDACEAAEQARGRNKKDQQQQQQEEEEELQEREESYRMAGESQSRSLRRASNVLRNILTCRVVEINDAALRPVSRPERSSSDGGGGGGGGSQLAARRRTNLEARHYDSRKSRSGGGKGNKMAGEKIGGVASAAAYKPFGAPYCSQCGKRFNPEKLHSHMKSCKALKARGNGYTNLQKGEYSRQVK